MALHRVSLVLAIAWSASCGGDTTASWVFRFEDPALADRAAFVQARLLEGGCVDGARVLWESDVGDEPPMEGAPPLAAGRYGLAGRARDAECRWFAAGCRDVTLPADDGATLEVALIAEPEEAECPIGACNDGVCREDAVVTVAAGRAHTCAVEVSGTVLCWGRNEEGALGNGTTVQSESAVAVRDLDHAVDVSVGGNAVGWQSHSCAIRAPDEVWCWGFNQFGQLGDGTTTTRTTPVQTMDIDAPASISAGDLHSCVVRITDARALCWGGNSRGQVGDGTTDNALTPEVVPDVSGVVQVAAGSEHSCARQQTGRVDCWGANDSGQLGDGTTTDRTTPVQASGTGRVMDISAGVSHTCAVREFDEPRTAVCWGNNSAGQLGDGTTTASATAVEVAGLEGILQIGAGADFTCARIDDGTIRCWGNNAFGALGDGTNADSLVPVTVAGIDDAIHLAVGNSHACAVRANGEVWCWGRNQFGRLGDGTIEDRSAPVAVAGLSP